MFKTVNNLVWAFDAEWVPDPRAGRLLYGLPDDLPDGEVMAHMWRENGATEENPTPYLKTVLCRLVSISVVQRHKHRDGRVTLVLRSLPGNPGDPNSGERDVLGPFLEAVGERKPQLVGFNSLAADIRIIVQRAIVLGLHAPRFAKRPDKPWEGMDYFARGGEGQVDLKDHVTPGWGQGSPSLHEIATLSGIPGKMGMDGLQVPPMWLEGRLDRIMAYNEFDALTTYLLWLRMAHFAGHFDSSGYEAEQERVRELLDNEAAAKPHLTEYRQEWERLRAAVI